MEGRYSVLFYVVLLVGFLWQAVIADVHPFSPDDLVRLKRLSSPISSPKGRHLALTISQYHPENNTRTQNLHILDLTDDSLAAITPPNPSISDSNPVWLSDSVLAFLSNRGEDKSTHAWVVDLRGWFDHVEKDRGASGGSWGKAEEKENKKRGDVISAVEFVEVKQLTAYPVPIANLKAHVASSQLAFTAEVYEDGDLNTAADRVAEEKARFSTGVVYDQLFVRHWDTWVHPVRKSNLFVVKYALGNGGASLTNEPFNVMKGLNLETPVAPFGDASNFDFSPEGDEIAFSSRVPEHSA
ncbi:hypothetical protein HK102_002393, partial [Quaeritorhiza haematococci]